MMSEVPTNTILFGHVLDKLKEIPDESIDVCVTSPPYWGQSFNTPIWRPIGVLSHLDKDWLYQKYIVEGLSTYDIAKIVSRDPKRAYQKLRDFNIPTRPRGLNLKGSDNAARMGIDGFAGKHHTKATRKILSDLASRPKPYLRGKNNGMYGRCGELSPKWRGGKTPLRQRLYASAEFREWFRKIAERDKNICQKCGKSSNEPRAMHVHHTQGFTNSPLHWLDVTQGITLCRECHHKAHKEVVS